MTSSVQAPVRVIGKKVTQEEDGALVVDERDLPLAANRPQAAMFFTPVTFTNVESPNEKIIGSQREIRKSDNKLQVRALPVIRFLNSKFVARTRQEYDRVKQACPRCFEEPAPEEREGKQLYQFKKKGRVIFETYVWEAFERFQSVYQRYGE